MFRKLRDNGDSQRDNHAHRDNSSDRRDYRNPKRRVIDETRCAVRNQARQKHQGVSDVQLGELERPGREQPTQTQTNGHHAISPARPT
jgi:hypothetical protein